MPGTEAEKQSGSHGDESINFRPSPNFKHMKKYLKSKFEEMNAAASNTTQEPSNTTQEPSNVELEEREKLKKMESNIQPPLPPNPPPPDSPLPTIKQEVVDDEYQCTNTTDSSDMNKSDDTFPPVSDQVITNKPEPIMCRNFVRGTCRKGSACIFVHELILSQLPGVYTFCKNFQNKQCVHAKCKFVHATVFEKEYFFRTGYLPPHATAHMKTTLAPPPPPPPEEAIQPVVQVFPNTPTFDASVPSVPVMACPPVPSTLPGPASEMYNIEIPDNTTSPLKREWAESDEFSRSPHHVDSGEPLAKKCKDCDANEFRYQYMKNKVEKMFLSSQERNQQIAQLNKKHERLCTVLMTLFKPGGSSTNPNILGSSAYVGGEKEQSILEQMNLVLNSNRLSFIGEESVKSFFGGLNF